LWKSLKQNTVEKSKKYSVIKKSSLNSYFFYKIKVDICFAIN